MLFLSNNPLQEQICRIGLVEHALPVRDKLCRTQIAIFKVVWLWSSFRTLASRLNKNLFILVRGEETHYSYIIKHPEQWEARGLTLIKHLEQWVARGLTVIKHPEQCEARGLTVIKYPEQWVARGLTLIKHLEQWEARGLTLIKHPKGNNPFYVHVVVSG